MTSLYKSRFLSSFRVIGGGEGFLLEHWCGILENVRAILEEIT